MKLGDVWIEDNDDLRSHVAKFCLSSASCYDERTIRRGQFDVQRAETLAQKFLEYLQQRENNIITKEVAESGGYAHLHYRLSEYLTDDQILDVISLLISDGVIFRKI